MRIKILGTLIVALGLAVAPVGAQPSNQPPGGQPSAGSRPIFGTIASVSGQTVVVTGRHGEAVTVTITPATKILGRREGTLAQIAVGDTIRLIADNTQDSSLTAIAVMDIPAGLEMPGPGGPGGAPQMSNGSHRMNGKTLVSGTVTKVSGAAVSIAAADGTATTVAVPQTARIELVTVVPATSVVVGARVMVQGTRSQDGSLTASVIMVMPQRPQ